jgi:hypothetical protein
MKALLLTVALASVAGVSVSASPANAPFLAGPRSAQCPRIDAKPLDVASDVDALGALS